MYIPYLFDLYGAIFKSSVGDWGINSSRIRLRRDDDDFEKEFNSVANVLDVASITDFNSWNMLDGGAYRDYLYDVPLGVDSNLDGVSDGWTYSESLNGTPDTEGNVQRIIVTDSDINNKGIIYSENIVASQGDIFSIRCLAKLEKNIGNPKLQLRIQYKNSSGSILSLQDENLLSADEYTEFKNTFTASHIDTAKINVELTFRSNANGDTGTAYFKNAIAVKNSFIEDVGLLTEDDDLDGVANEWSYSANGFDGTVVKSVSDDGQKMEVTVAGTNTSEPYTFLNSSVSNGDEITLRVEARVNGDVEGLLIITEKPTGDSGISTAITNTEWATKTLTITVDDGDTSIDSKLRLVPNQVGSTGYVEYRNATLKQTNNSTFVSKVFDKSGHGNHAIQTVSSYQPRLINAGVFEVMSDGDYGMFFDGVDDRFDVVDNDGLDITSGDLSLLANFDNANATGYIVSRNNNDSGNVQYGILDLNNVSTFRYGDSGTLPSIGANVNSKIVICTYDHTNTKIYEDGIVENSLAHSSDLITRPYIQIGCRSSSTDGLTKSSFLTGHINRITVFTKALNQNEITYLTSKV